MIMVMGNGMAITMIMDTGMRVTAIGNGVAIMTIMDIGMAITTAIGTGLSISNPISTPNLSTSRRQCTMCHSNRPASVYFFRLIFTVIR